MNRDFRAEGDEEILYPVTCKSLDVMPSAHRL